MTQYNFEGIALQDLLSRLGQAINQLRLKENKSEKELAQLSGVSLRTLQRLIQGQPAGSNTLLRILRALGRLDLLSPLLQQDSLSPMQQLKNKPARKRIRTSTKRLPGDRAIEKPAMPSTTLQDLDIALSNRAAIAQKYKKKSA